MTPRNRDEEGRYETEHGVGKDDVLDSMEPLEPYTTGEIAEKLGAPRRSVYNYLEKLYEEGKIQKKKPEPRRAIWMRGK